MTSTEVLSDEQWQARAKAHRDRLEPFVAAHQDRTRRGVKHPVWDFLFTYYGHRPAHLLRWYPGIGTRLAGPEAVEHFGAVRGFAVLDGVVGFDPVFAAQRAGTARYVADLLAATAQRTPVYGCFGLHEWAMAYRVGPQIRHPVPLRLGTDGTDRVVESASLRCTHYDAFRFFTRDAAPRNAMQLTRAGQIDAEQPGCLHAGMDLYKWAFKLGPAVPAELVADAFELARDARELDMSASPYDLTNWGFEPVPIETSAGRAEYIRRQKWLAERAGRIRVALLAVVRAWPTERGVNF